VAWPIRHILRKQQNATVLMAEVRAVDTTKRLVQIDSVSIPYDYLVLRRVVISPLRCRRNPRRR
jgi:NADH:ubiquinone reductase (H+-translocating)